MRKVIATTNSRVKHSIFSDALLKQLGDFEQIPIYARFCKDMHIGTAKYPEIKDGILTAELDVDINLLPLTYSVGYTCEDFISQGEQACLPKRVTIKCIGTVADTGIHD